METYKHIGEPLLFCLQVAPFEQYPAHICFSEQCSPSKPVWHVHLGREDTLKTVHIPLLSQYPVQGLSCPIYV